MLKVEKKTVFPNVSSILTLLLVRSAKIVHSEDAASSFKINFRTC